MKQKRAIAHITALSHDGRGIAHVDGKTVFLQSGLVGEEVEFEYLKQRSRYDEGQVTQVLSPSSQRVTPACEHFGVCGGCSLQHMAVKNQLEYKEKVLLEQLQHMGGVSAEQILQPISAANLGYRTKARLGVKYVEKKQKLLIGFRERNGRYLADIERCPILPSHIGEKIPELRELLMELSNYLQIPQLEIAVGDNNTAIIIRHLTAFAADDFLKIQQFSEKYNYHIYLQPGDSTTVQLFWPKNVNQRLSYQLPQYQLEFLFHPTDFTQVNREINQRLVDLAIKLLAPQKDQKILDLFCGMGNFSLPIARFCQQVIGVEGSLQMVERARENAVHNNIKNTDFYCIDLARNFYNDYYIKQEFHAVLIDPPRSGAKEILQFSHLWNSQRIVYVSCNPATLARDAGYLHHMGYNLKSVGVLDMFPHTNHVESIALFEKREKH